MPGNLQQGFRVFSCTVQDKRESTKMNAKGDIYIYIYMGSAGITTVAAGHLVNQLTWSYRRALLGERSDVLPSLEHHIESKKCKSLSNAAA